MDRRHFLTATGASFGAALLAPPVASAGVRLDGSGLADALRERADRLRSTPAPELLRRASTAAGLPSDFASSALASLSVFAPGLDDDAEQAAGRRRAQRREAHRMGKHVLAAAAYLRGLSRERRRGLRAQLKAEPDLARWLTDGLRGRSDGAEREDVRALADELDGLTARLRDQDPAVLFDGLVGRVERSADSAGLGVDEWDDAVADADDDDAGVHADDDALEPQRRSHRTAKVGLILLGIGLGAGLVALGTLALPGAVGAFFVFGCLGAAVVLVALIALAIAGVQSLGDGESLLRTDVPYTGRLGDDVVSCVFAPGGGLSVTVGEGAAAEVRGGAWEADGGAIAAWFGTGEQATWLDGTTHDDGMRVRWRRGEVHGRREWLAAQPS